MDWAGLHVDMLIDVLVRLRVVDWLSFIAVCKDWSRAVETASSCRRRPKAEPPWLMLPRGDDPAMADFFSVTGDLCCSIALPHPANRGSMWIGSTDGWLVAADEEGLEGRMRLLNPITGVQLSLPSIRTMGYFDQVPPRTESSSSSSARRHSRLFLEQHADNTLLHFQLKAVASWDGERYCVMLIHGPARKLAFARQGDAEWVMLPSRCHYEDVALYKGRFCTVTTRGVFQTWGSDRDGGASLKPKIAAPDIAPCKDGDGGDICFRKKYLVESSDGNLMLIWRQLRSRSRGNDAKLRFRVFALHEGCGGSEWREVHDLGGAAIFIDHNSAVFFLPPDGAPGLMPDCIYFTADIVGDSLQYFEQGSRGMEIFDMNSKLTKVMPSIGSRDRVWPPPVWITPSVL